MRAAIALVLVAQAVALDIPQLIDSLGPAPDNDPRFTNWIAPGPDDVRSPCPGLNSLANHGFIHHDGRNMTIPHLLEGLAAGMNIGPDFTTVVGAVGILGAADPASGMFNLDDLDKHNRFIEHDASLSRQDAYFGNDYSFYRPNWNVVLNAYAGQVYTSPETSGKARYARTQNSLQTNPNVTYGAREFLFGYGETGLYTQTMSNPLSQGVARVDFVKMLFEQEKLPYELGWRVSKIPITLDSLGAAVVQTFAAYPRDLPEGLTITAMSYRDIFEVTAGGSAALANLTDGISTYLGL